ncbi:hypothetical protein HBH64_160540 [Parastagonospora nodorum]|nr:hypothetical protein HBH47_137850 [Parastagonospora nodorum]KAH4311200.1 hypothetical protein HBI01_018000 [Parastagonospora nodorum]KAH4317074.1 hypothetical protein HBI02_034340 [Parastagonospora nodorum]KAH4326549.1 hypothetical protein HBI00_138250 [Parastagonospora nodorum]KAH4388403.1 hypothetical protein HBH94_034220 [Parastagonospora nodorum]
MSARRHLPSIKSTLGIVNQSNMSETNTTPASLLLCLPAELRNAIYEYVFNDPHDLQTEVALEHGAIRFYGYTETDLLGFVEPSMPLLLVNRQLHTETRMIPFDQGTFVFRDRGTFQAFLQSRTQDQKAAIAFLKLGTVGGQLYPYKWDDYEATYLKSIIGFSGLKSIEIMDEYPPSYRLVRLLVDMYTLASKGSPGVKIMVRDQDGYCGQLPEGGPAGRPGLGKSQSAWRGDFGQMMELAKELHPRDAAG